MATYVAHKKIGCMSLETTLTCLQCNILSCNEACSETLEAERYCQQTDPDIYNGQRNSSHHLQHQTTKLLASEGLHLQEQTKVTGTHAQMVKKMFQSLPLPSCLKGFHCTCPTAVYGVNVDALYALPDNYPKPFCSILHSALWALRVVNDITDIKSKSITCDLLGSWQFWQMRRAWLAPFVCVAFQSGLVSSCPYVVKGHIMVQKFITFIFLLFKAEDGNIMCVMVCVCVCVCVCAVFVLM